jgi:hypothetical protein
MMRLGKSVRPSRHIADLFLGPALRSDIGDDAAPGAGAVRRGPRADAPPAAFAPGAERNDAMAKRACLANVPGQRLALRRIVEQVDKQLVRQSLLRPAGSFGNARARIDQAALVVEFEQPVGALFGKIVEQQLDCLGRLFGFALLDKVAPDRGGVGGDAGSQHDEITDRQHTRSECRCGAHSGKAGQRADPAHRDVQMSGKPLRTKADRPGAHHARRNDAEQHALVARSHRQQGAGQPAPPQPEAGRIAFDRSPRRFQRWQITLDRFEPAQHQQPPAQQCDQHRRTQRQFRRRQKPGKNQRDDRSVDHIGNRGRQPVVSQNR